MTQTSCLSGGILEEQYDRLPRGERSWHRLLAMEFARDPERYADLDRTLTALYAAEPVNPARENLLKAFAACPLESVRVVICGQDPYPNASHAMGLSFSVPAGVKLPPSLKNILQELESDIGPEVQVRSGDLTPWAEQGVLLLNTALTVREGEPNSHKALWDGFAVRVLSLLNQYQQKPLVFLLWGKQAQDIGARMEKTAPTGYPRKFLYGVHPSPLSAYRGFFGSRPFSQINAFLQAQGQKPIRW